MDYLFLDRQVKKALASAQDGKVTVLKAIDTNVAFQALGEVVLKNTLSQKTTLIIAPDHEESELIYEQLSKRIKVNNHLLNWSKDSHTPLSSLGFTQKFDKSNIFDNSREMSYKHKVLEFLEIKIKKIVDNFSQSLYKNFSWSELSSIISFYPSKHFPLTIADYEVLDIQLINNEIDNLFEKYQQKFDLLTIESKFNQKIYASNDDLNVALLQLSTCKENIKDLITRFDTIYHELVANISRKLHKEYTTGFRYFDQIELQLIQQSLPNEEIKSVKKSFFSKWSQSKSASIPQDNNLSDAWQDAKGFIAKTEYLKHLLFNNFDEEILGVELAESTLANFHSLVDNWQQQSATLINDTLKRLSVYALNHQELISICQQYDELILDINSKDIFAEPLIGKTINLVKLQENIYNTDSKITQAIKSILLNEDYNQWKFEFEKSNNISKQLFVHLKNVNKEDRNILIKNSIFRVLIQKHHLPEYQFFNQYLQEYWQLSDQIIENALSIADNYWISYREEQLNILQSSMKELHKNIIKHKEYSTTAFDLSTSHIELIKSCYPIQIVTDKQLMLTLKSKAQLWDTVVIFNTKKFEKTQHLYLDNRCQNVLALKLDLTENHDDINELRSLNVAKDELHIFESRSFYLDQVQPIENLHVSSRLPYAQRLASNILDITTDFRVYFVNNKFIISFLKPINNSLLQRFFQNDHLKEIQDSNGMLIDVLVDPFKEIICLVENNLIEGNCLNFAWQLRLIEMLDNSGIKVYSYNAILNTDHSSKEFSKFLKSLFFDDVAKNVSTTLSKEAHKDINHNNE